MRSSAGHAGGTVQLEGADGGARRAPCARNRDTDARYDGAFSGHSGENQLAPFGGGDSSQHRGEKQALEKISCGCGRRSGDDLSSVPENGPGNRGGHGTPRILGGVPETQAERKTDSSGMGDTAPCSRADRVLLCL